MTFDSCLVPRTDEPVAFLVSPRNLGHFPDRMELGILVLEARENRRSRRTISHSLSHSLSQSLRVILIDLFG